MHGDDFKHQTFKLLSYMSNCESPLFTVLSVANYIYICNQQCVSNFGTPTQQVWWFKLEIH